MCKIGLFSKPAEKNEGRGDMERRPEFIHSIWGFEHRIDEAIHLLSKVRERGIVRIQASR